MQGSAGVATGRVRRGILAFGAAAALVAAAGVPTAAAGPVIAATVRAVVRTRTAGPNLVALAFAGNRHGWMAGPGVILATSNGGTTWRRQYTGNASVVALDAVDASHVWALAANGLLATSDGGRVWTPRAEPPQALGSLRRIQFVTAALGFGLTGPRYGPAAHLVRTENGGRSWTALTMPAGTASVCFTGAADGWAATGTGQTQAAVYRTMDGGAMWRRVLAPSGALGAQVGCAGSSAWVLAIGGTGMTQTAYSLFRTADGGGKWVRVLATGTAGGGPAPGGSAPAPRGPGVSPGPMAVIGPKTVAFFGVCEACGTGAGTIQLALSSDGGSSWWEGLPVAGATAIGEPVASFPSASQGWLLAEAGQARPVLLHTVDGGRTWRPQYPTTSPSPLLAVDFVNAKIGFGLGTAGDSGAVLRTSNGGSRWTQVGDLLGSISATVGLSFVSSRVGWAVAGNGGLVRTSDGGRTWSGVPVYAAARAGGSVTNVGAVYDIAFVNARDGCVRGLSDNLLFGTLNGGGTWHVQPAQPSAWMCASRLAGTLPAPMRTAANRPAAVQNGQYAGTGGQGRFTWVWTGSDLYTSQDGGARWTHVALANTALGNFVFADASHGWSLLWDGRLYATSDGGAHWQEVR